MALPVTRIPISRPQLDRQDIDAVARAMESAWLTGGPLLNNFELALGEYLGAQHVVCLNSGTAALLIAVLALELPHDARMALPSITFAASANAAVLAGAQPVFCEVDESLQLDPGQVPWADIHAVMPVHYAGQAYRRADELFDAASLHGVPVVVDAAPSLGAVGSRGPFDSRASATCFSFHTAKPITSGDGGCIATDRPEFAERARLLAWHGIQRDPAKPWKLEAVSNGFKFILPEMSAALGLSQLSKIEHFLDRRRSLAKRYDRLLADLPITRPVIDVDTSACQIYPILLSDDGPLNEVVIHEMRKVGIEAAIHYPPLHLQPAFRQFQEHDLRYSEVLGNRLVSLPLFVGMTEDDQNQVCSALGDIVGRS